MLIKIYFNSRYLYLAKIDTFNLYLNYICIIVIINKHNLKI